VGMSPEEEAEYVRRMYGPMPSMGTDKTKLAENIFKEEANLTDPLNTKHRIISNITHDGYHSHNELAELIYLLRYASGLDTIETPLEPNPKNYKDSEDYADALKKYTEETATYYAQLKALEIDPAFIEMLEDYCIHALTTTEGIEGKVVSALLEQKSSQLVRSEIKEEQTTQKGMLK